MGGGERILLKVGCAINQLLLAVMLLLLVVEVLRGEGEREEGTSTDYYTMFEKNEI